MRDGSGKSPFTEPWFFYLFKSRQYLVFKLDFSAFCVTIQLQCINHDADYILFLVVYKVMLLYASLSLLT